MGSRTAYRIGMVIVGLTGIVRFVLPSVQDIYDHHSGPGSAGTPPAAERFSSDASGTGYGGGRVPGGRAGSSIAERIAGDGPVAGDPSAPHLLAAASAPSCVPCGRFHRAVSEWLMDGPVPAGKIRYAYRPLIRSPADAAALDVMACADPRIRSRVTAAILSRPGRWAEGGDVPSRLAGVAAAAGMDRARARSCARRGYGAFGDASVGGGLFPGTSLVSEDFGSPGVVAAVDDVPVKGAAGRVPGRKAIRDALARARPGGG